MNETTPTERARLLGKISVLRAECERLHAVLAAARTVMSTSPVPQPPEDCELPNGLPDWIAYALNGWKAERAEAAHLAKLCDDAHKAITNLDGPSTGTPAPALYKAPTMDDLGVLLDFWSRELRLMDWDITLETYRLPKWVDLGKGAYTAGFLSSNASTGAATIRMLDVADMPADIAPGYRDCETTLVHEMLHMLMPVSATDGSDHDGERAINRVAEALVRLRRAAAVI